jgi:hypothetical protein
MLEELRARADGQRRDRGGPRRLRRRRRTSRCSRRGATSRSADPASGNTQAGGQWLFDRRITVQRVKGANDVRLVNVGLRERRRGSRVLAESRECQHHPHNMPPTQVYDVYLVAIENVPGWWLYIQNIVPFVEGAMSTSGAPSGLEFRKHWIRKLSYGRDPLYTPYV